jgi:nucleotidyltransferase/DNA polymerase involved in DNA repair
MGLPLPGVQTRTSCDGLSQHKHEQTASRGLGLAYEVALAVALIDQVSSIASAGVAQGILGPFGVVGHVSLHGLAQNINVDIIRGQARVLAKSISQDVYELVKVVHGGWLGVVGVLGLGGR